MYKLKLIATAMKHVKQLLFLSVLCSLVLFTNCSDSDDVVVDTPTNNTDDDKTDDGTTDPVNYTLTLTASEGGTVTLNRVLLVK